jgi:selenocysteine lyase/cysteine desulfurase
VRRTSARATSGTPDVAGPVGLAAAIDLLTAIGNDATWRHDQDLVRHGLARLREAFADVLRIRSRMPSARARLLTNGSRHSGR